MSSITITEDYFMSEYSPLTHMDYSIAEVNPNDPRDRDLFDRAVEENRLWTEVETDTGYALLSGYHIVNQTRYIVTEVPHGGADISVINWMDDESQ
jgi:hypothetical protein